MNHFPLKVVFIDKQTGERVPGEIRPAAEKDIEGWLRWSYRSHDEDKVWNWFDIFSECALSTTLECFSAIAKDEVQGFAVLDVKPVQMEGGAAITLDYLATNPANRLPTSGLKYVGYSLLALTALRSQLEGFDGSFRLESLPGACAFYESLGLQKQLKRSADGYAVYYLDGSGAQRLLDRIQQQGILKI